MPGRPGFWSTCTQVCPKNLCHRRGSPHFVRFNLGSIRGSKKSGFGPYVTPPKRLRIFETMVRDQEDGGSNQLAPTNFIESTNLQHRKSRRHPGSELSAPSARIMMEGLLQAKFNHVTQPRHISLILNSDGVFANHREEFQCFHAPR